MYKRQHLHHGEREKASHSKPSAVSVAAPEASAPVAPVIQPPAASAPQSPEPEVAVPDSQAQTQIAPAPVSSSAPDAAAAVPSAPSASGLQPEADQNLHKQQDVAAVQKSVAAAGTEQSAVPMQPPATVQNVGTTEHNVDSAQNVGAVQPVACLLYTSPSPRD